MKEPLAFKATYSDWKLIKTRGMVQIVMEVPLGDADAAYQILGGMPDFGRDVWFAIAPLKNPPAAKESIAEPPVAPDKPLPEAKRMGWSELQPAAQAGIRCADPVFKTFLREHYTKEWKAFAYDAADVVRDICGVQSRSELGTNHRARVLWHQLDEQFQAWKLIDT